MKVRHATIDDAQLLLNWRNDPLVRNNAFSTEIITLENHLSWLNKKLSQTDCDIYIVEWENFPIGQVRLEKSGPYVEIHYGLGSDYRGRQLATPFLYSALKFHINNPDQDIEFLAKVKPDNQASCKVFEKLGFQSTHDLEHITFTLSAARLKKV